MNLLLRRYWIIIPAVLYGLCWLLSYSYTSGVTIEKVGANVQPTPITLPFLEISEPILNPNVSPSGIFYIVKGIITLPYLSLADRLIIKTDDCPVALKINGKPISLAEVPPLQDGCNFRDDEFSLDIKQANLGFGKNIFELTFNDIGGHYGVSIQAKSVLLKKSIIFVVPLVFIGLFVRFIGVTRRDFLSLHTLIAGLLLAAGVFAISLSYSELSQTRDEASHTAAGMEWWGRSAYTFEAMHPPLARIAEAAMLYLNDVTLASQDYRKILHNAPDEPHWEGGRILFDKNNAYVRNVTLARMGVLPFYILAGCMVFIWSNSLFGRGAALASLLLYVICPGIAGHAGLAITDMPYAAMFILAVFTYIKWLEQPNFFNSIFLGIATGLMLMAKLSSVGHFPAAIYLITLWHFAYLKKHCRGREVNGTDCFINGTLIMLPCFLLVLQSIYYFDNFRSLIAGIRHVYEHNIGGHAYWLFGPLNNHGVWYFFPVAFFYKNPLPFLFLILTGIVTSFHLFKKNLNQRIFFPLLAAIGVMIPSMLGNINLGIRHILPVFLLMTIPAGYGVMQMVQSKKPMVKAAVAALIIWQVASFIWVSPDYMAYFNEFAGSHPENILMDSDLDWGQDLYRLEKAIEKNDIKEIAVCYLGSVDLTTRLKARLLPCPIGNPTYKGWTAVDHMNRKLDSGLFWLDNYTYTPVGKSMNLYHIQ